MSSRIEKCNENNSPNIKQPSRTNKNARLYKEVYGKYEDLDNLPIEDNTDEIDIETLKELITNSNNQNEQHYLKESLNILDTRKRKIDEQKLYDINKILEKAKNDNSKLKETTIRETIINKDILSTLESKEISLSEIREASIKYEEKILNEKELLEEEKVLEEKELDDEKILDEEISEQTDLTMTREFKFKELSDEVEKFNSNPLIEQVMPDNDLSLDLFEELKPTGNTIVTKPIKENNITNIHSSDTTDIDVIKPSVGNLEEFFTNSYEFSKKDFANLNDEDTEFFETKKDNNFLKIILLILAIIVFAGAIVFFIKNYGLGL